MAFIERVVGPDEKLIGVLSVHWIYAVKGLMWMAGFMILGMVIDTQVDKLVLGYEGYAATTGLQILSNYAFWTSSFIGFMLLMFYVTMMLTTELGLTSKRVIYKTGLMAVDVKESDLDEIKAADVNSGIFGSILNYGYLVFDARFVANISLPAIADPYRFIKAMNEARSLLLEESLPHAIGDSGAPTVQTKGSHRADQRDERPENAPETHYNINEDRYKGTESNPIKAAANMLDDAIGETKRSVKKIKKDAKTISSTNFKKAHKETNEKVSNAAEEIKSDLSETAEAVKNPSAEQKDSHKPTVFAPDLKKRKRNLRAKIKRTFSSKSDAPDA